MPSAAVIRQKVWLLRSSSVGSLMKEEMERKEGRFCPPFRLYLKEKKSQAQRKRKATMITMQMKLELIPVPVTDVDRAKAFYTEKIGFHAPALCPVDPSRFGLLHRDWGGHHHHAARIARRASDGGPGRESHPRGTGQTRR